jgi:hypothetical protein
MTTIPWLSLLQRLTAGAPTWGVWKRPDSALYGDGDIDSVASTDDWETIVREFRAWAFEHRFGPVVACTHIPSLLVIAACDGDSPTRLLQMDIYSRHVFRGTSLVDADALQPFMRHDDRGFRRLRPGAEALLVLLHEGVRHGGRPAEGGLAHATLDQVRRDPEGAYQLASAIGLPRQIIRAVERGEWERWPLVAFELRAALRLRNPKELAVCVARDYRRFRRCALLNALRDGRQVSGERKAWLREVGRSHIVYDVDAEQLTTRSTGTGLP